MGSYESHREAELGAAPVAGSLRMSEARWLVVYADGVSEARSPDGTFFGEERIECILRSSAGLDASALASRIENAVLMFQENGSRDDVAILVLRVPE